MNVLSKILVLNERKFERPEKCVFVQKSVKLLFTCLSLSARCRKGSAVPLPDGGIKGEAPSSNLELSSFFTSKHQYIM